jgi:bifunctional ADP-heptose synthase (sugar kinase/adenylyltransferase)
MIAPGARRGKVVLVDPKGSDYSRYRGASVITPNRAELQDVVGRWSSEDDLRTKAQNLRARWTSARCCSRAARKA